MEYQYQILDGNGVEVEIVSVPIRSSNIALLQSKNPPENATAKQIPFNPADLTGPSNRLLCARKVESDPHAARMPSMIQCVQCGRVWCCWECCIEHDAMDHHFSDMIYDHDGKSPDVWRIICCQCSGKPKSYEDREDEA